MKVQVPVFECVEQMWTNAIEAIIENGHEIDCRNGGSTEVLGFIGRLNPIQNNVLLNPVRKFSHRYAAAELLWYLSGDPSGEMIEHYAPSYRNFLEADGIAWGAYGGRWASHGQLHHLFDLLSEKENTRQGVISMWEPKDLQASAQAPKKDVPCTLSLQFIVRDDKLHCFVTMRSNDIWLGFPYDVFCFTSLQMFLADYLGLGYGQYQHAVGSMHLYHKDKLKAIQALEQQEFFSPPFSKPVERRGFDRFIGDLRIALRTEQVMRLVNPEAATVDNPFPDGNRWFQLIEAVRPKS